MDDTRRRVIDQCAFYKVESLRALALEAADIKSDKDREGADYFKQVTGRTVAVWARLTDRFPTWFDRDHEDFTNATPDGFTALTFLCQLPAETCAELYEAHINHINEPNAHLLVLADVNEHKPTRERKPKTCAACDRVRTLAMQWRANGGNEAQAAVVIIAILDPKRKSK